MAATVAYRERSILLLRKNPKPIQNKKSTETIMFYYIFEKDDAGTTKISTK